MIAIVCVLIMVVVLEFMVICAQSRSISKLKDMLEEDESILSVSGYGHEQPKA